MFGKCCWLLLVAVTIPSARGDTDVYRDSNEPDTEGFRYPSHNSMLCMNVRPQNSLNVEQLLGQWFGNEIIIHTPATPGVFNYPCVQVDIDDFTEQMRSINLRRSQFAHQQTSYYYGGSSKPDTFSPFSTGASNGNGNGRQHAPHHNVEEEEAAKYLRLVWTERDENLEYTLNYTNSNPGYWTSVGDQRGSLVTLKQYTQFAGSVQVVKAVNDHMVLTFCGTNPQSTVYSIVLNRRDESLSDEKIISLRKMLWRRGLAVDSVRKVCVKSGAKATAMATSSTMLLLLVVAALGALNKSVSA